MKGCLIAIAIILAIIIVLVGAFAIYLFAFEKELPANVVDAIKDGLKGVSSYSVDYNFTVVNEFGDVDNTYLESKSGKTTKHYMSRKGKDATLTVKYERYEGDVKKADYYFYQEDGKYLYKQNDETPQQLSQSDWEEIVTSTFFGTMPFVVEDGKAKLLGGDAIEKDLKTVKQKGYDITAIAENDTAVYTMTYNLKSGELTGYSIAYHATGYVDKYIITIDLGKIDLPI